MQYELYVDRLFGMWFCIHLFLLVLTAAAGHLKLVRWRTVTAAAMGSLFFLAVFLWPLGDSRIAAAGKLLLQTAGSLMVLQAAFGFETVNACLRAGGIFGVCAILLGGGMTAFFKKNAVNYSQILLSAALLCVVGMVMAGREWQQGRMCMYTVVLYEGKHRVRLRALMDSGDSLRDPISADPVCVVHKSVISELGLRDVPERFRAIPYHAVGTPHGILQGWIVEKMEIRIRGQRWNFSRVVLAQSEQLSDNENYRMLLHPALLEEKRGENHDIKSCDAGKDAV